MINREIVGYLSKISSEFSVISVMGARHCGKTTLVKSEIKSGMEMTPSFARNIVTYREVLGADLLTSSIIYSGPSNRHVDPASINYGDI